MVNTDKDPEREPRGKGPESGRRIRGKPGTEQAKRAERDRDRTGADTRRASTGPDPDEQTDFSGVEKKLEGPLEEKDGTSEAGGKDRTP